MQPHQHIIRKPDIRFRIRMATFQLADFGQEIQTPGNDDMPIARDLTDHFRIIFHLLDDRTRRGHRHDFDVRQEELTHRQFMGDASLAAEELM